MRKNRKLLENVRTQNLTQRKLESSGIWVWNLESSYNLRLASGSENGAGHWCYSTSVLVSKSHLNTETSAFLTTGSTDQPKSWLPSLPVSCYCERSISRVKCSNFSILNIIPKVPY